MRTLDLVLKQRSHPAETENNEKIYCVTGVMCAQSNEPSMPQKSCGCVRIDCDVSLSTGPPAKPASMSLNFPSASPRAAPDKSSNSQTAEKAACAASLSGRRVRFAKELPEAVLQTSVGIMESGTTANACASLATVSYRVMREVGTSAKNAGES